ncbi:RSP_2648 family PIN domain-containing protein [Qingshengfaniella alkalisoli]|uniref:PIN domain-containing protein n=1 Tax=Qingshengfaniella alkalisoli TaxID=2599296 RepID=A0A5B8IUM8_9RHOB|nr:PIN domain-containing protein [Qingshengfaniella alkalisoli]QDY69364.1 PIN domain-containing protein [Qingshengfaniella alkalisoli]
MRAVLDACVLYPTLLRQVLLAIASEGLFDPIWSVRIIEEWRRAVIRHHPDQAGIFAAEAVRLADRFPAASFDVTEEDEAALFLPDRNDRHVLATALAANTPTIITLNLKDFPSRALSEQGVRAKHPDLVLLELLGDHPSVVRTAIKPPVEAAMAATGLGRRAVLKKARLPRFAKALDQS